MNYIEADTAVVNNLTAAYIAADNILAGRITAAEARISNIEADYVKTSFLKSDVTFGGFIYAKGVSANKIVIMGEDLSDKLSTYNT